MATKRYNKVTFTFYVGIDPVSFYCDTTYTRNGFVHHVHVWGFDKKGEHSRVIYWNRTWETFVYESALKHAISKFPKRLQADLRRQVQKIADRKGEESRRDLEKFTRAFESLSDEKKAAVRKYTPEITNIDQANFVTAAVQMFAAV